MSLVLKDYWAEWCGPCKLQKPIIEALEKEMKDVKFEKINVDEESEKTSKAGVLSIPTLVIEKDGKESGKMQDDIKKYSGLGKARNKALGKNQMARGGYREKFRKTLD